LQNNKQFENFWAIILGGSSGFGFAAVDKLAKHGMNIAVLYRETAQAEKTLKIKFEKLAKVNNIQILSFNINALEENGRSKFIEEFKKVVTKKNCIRLLMHSIARGNLKPVVKKGKSNKAEVISIQDIEFTNYAMATSLLDWARLLFDENLFCYDARIIGLTSAGAHKYWESYTAVSLAKASLESLATYMAVEFGKFGLKTNLIHAGITATPSLKKISGSDKLVNLAKEINPLGRITTPADVANVIYLLCTDEAFWINGAVIHVDGGEHCR
jgi:enoyl-[acyl-carrier protein] reductase III